MCDHYEVTCDHMIYNMTRTCCTYGYAAATHTANRMMRLPMAMLTCYDNAERSSCYDYGIGFTPLWWMQSGRAPISYAAEHGQWDVVLKLMDMGADVNNADEV